MRLWNLVRGRRLDVGLDIALVVLAIVSQVDIWTNSEAQNQPVLVPLTLLWTLAPLARRRFPFAAPIVSLVALASISFVAESYLTTTPTAFVGLAVISGIIGAYNEPRLAAVGLLVVGAAYTIVVGQDPTETFAGGLLAILIALASWLLGLAWYRRTEYAAELRERAELAEREREITARVAVAEERARIARELHDVVAHSVSVMVLQTGAVRRLLTDEQSDEREALLSVEQTGREALGEMRRLLGVMRAEGDGPALAPQPGLASLDSLVANIRQSGLPVELRIEGEPATLPPGIELSAYRIVQEGLTNVLRHAGAAHAEVVVRYRPDEVEIEIADDGSGPDGAESNGHGLIGMRERVKVYGGQLHAGARPGGGYLLRAQLPARSGSS